MKPFSFRALAVVGSLLLGMGATSVQAATYTVSNTNDSGEGSLRQAITDANATADVEDTIEFDASVFSTPQTIAFASTLPSVQSDLTIKGPTLATARLTLRQASSSSGLLMVSFSRLLRPDVYGAVSLSVSDLTFTGAGVAISRLSPPLPSVGTIVTGSAKLTTQSCTFAGSGTGISSLYFNSCLIQNCTFTGNSQGFSGGNATIQNCTFVGNTTAVRASRPIILDSCTIAGNVTGIEPPYIFGIAGPSVRVSNSLMVGNTTNINNTPRRTVVFDAYSLSNGTAAAAGLQTSDGINGVVLQDNGGAPQTVALIAGAAAINAGSPSFDASKVLTDQRGSGFARVSNGRLDLGAFEFQFSSTAPVIKSISIDKTAPKTRDILTATPLATNANGSANDTLTYSFQWQKNGVDIAGETGDSLDLGRAGNGNKGDIIRVRITARNAAGELSGGATSATVTVANSVPTLTDPVINQSASGSAPVLFVASPTTNDDDVSDGIDTLTLRYQWKKNGQNLSGQTGQELDLSKVAKGDRVTVVATVSDQSDSVSKESSAVTVVNSTPQVQQLTFTPTAPTRMSLLTALIITSDLDAVDTVTTKQQWKLNGVTLVGETGTTLDLSKIATVRNGDQIALTVTASDGMTSSVAVTREVVVVDNGAPRVESLTPNNVIDRVSNERTFGVTISDANGVGDIKEVWLLINKQLSWNAGATLIYVPSVATPTKGQLFLRSGDAFLPPIQIGANSSAVLANGAVSIVAHNVTVYISGNQMTLNLPLSILDGLVGTNRVFARVVDKNGALDPTAAPSDSGYRRFGNYTVTPQFSGSTNSAPTVSPLSPVATNSTLSSMGLGPVQTFGLSVTDADGTGDIESIWFAAGKSSNWTRSATFIYTPQTRRLVLRSDDGQSFLGGGVIGTAGVIENSQVRVDLSQVRVVANGDGKTLIVVLPLQAKGGLLGQNKVYLRVQDLQRATAANGDVQGYVQSGTWNVVQEAADTSNTAPSGGGA